MVNGSVVYADGGQAGRDCGFANQWDRQSRAEWNVGVSPQAAQDSPPRQTPVHRVQSGIQYIIEAMIQQKNESSDWLFPSKVLNSHYTETALRQAVGHACKAAEVKHWTPYQLRHLAGTTIATEHGLEAAAAVLGHSSTGVTQIYAHEPDAETLRRAV